MRVARDRAIDESPEKSMPSDDDELSSSESFTAGVNPSVKRPIVLTTNSASQEDDSVQKVVSNDASEVL